MTHPVITTTDALSAFCTAVRDPSGFIAVDTEFLRDNTYWPKLCLVQVAGETEAAAIDPLAPGIDLAPLIDLMADPAVLKVFHSARQDIEIFVALTGKVPMPLWDTQIAAMVCGLGDQIGYESLLKNLNIVGELDKASRFTDWSARPLTDRQIDYAMGDVTHLREAYKVVKSRLEDQGRSHWISEEMAVLEAVETYITEPQDAWRRLKLRNPKRKMLAVLQPLAAWREKEAKKRNLPRSRLLKDETLIELATQVPRTVDRLSRTRSLSKSMAEGWQGKAILEAIEVGLNTPQSEWPEIERRPTLPADIGPTVDLLKVLLKLQCQKNGVAPRLIASTDDLDLLAGQDEPDIPALKGWRREVFGNHALSLKAGKLAFAVEDREIVVLPRDTV